MPRLTAKDYLANRNILREDWLDNGSIMSHLPLMDQRNLHDYFALASDLDNGELLARRQAITIKRPSLAQKAGKSYATFSTFAARPRPVLAQPAMTSTEIRRRGQERNRVVKVRALIRPEIDIRKLGVALIDLARELERDRESPIE